MIHQTIFLVALILLIQTDLSATNQIICDLNYGNYTSSSVYGANLNITLSSLSENVDKYGFYNASTGQGSDQVNAMALCRGDLQLDTCRSCVQTAAAELVEKCPNQKQAIRWDESCTLRYSNAFIYGIMSTFPAMYVWQTQNASSQEQFNGDLGRLMDDLRKKAAAGSSLMKQAAGSAIGPDFQTIFGFMHCTPDLSEQNCTNCLVEAIKRIPSCCGGKTGGEVLFPSCIILFATTAFVNETRLQEREMELALELVPPPPPAPVSESPLHSPPPQGKNNSKTTRTIVMVVAVIGGCFILAVSVIIFLKKRNQHKSTENTDVEDEISISESLQYAFSTIKSATKDFSEDNKLGQGGFGPVYKGKLPNDQEIAVKRLSRDSGQGDMEFKNEVRLLAKLQHRNLVRLLGYALEGMEKLLVYEFVHNSSLDHFIFDPNNHSKLDWGRRYMIITGIARGVLYLHEDSRLKIIHRDLKASNILLDKEMNPKISDFGMARLFRQDETHGDTSRIVGTYGYMPPEYLIHGQFSIKSDVFSFGVLILELISGRRNSNFPCGEGREDLVSFAWKRWEEGRAADVIHPFLKSGSGSINEMVRCIHIGLLCVQEDAVDRPTMASVVLMLSSFSITLALPSRPAFFYGAGFSSDVSRSEYYNSTSSDKQKSLKQQDQSSPNDSSITALYPR